MRTTSTLCFATVMMVGFACAPDKGGSRAGGSSGSSTGGSSVLGGSSAGSSPAANGSGGRSTSNISSGGTSAAAGAGGSSGRASSGAAGSTGSTSLVAGRTGQGGSGSATISSTAIGGTGGSAGRTGSSGRAGATGATAGTGGSLAGGTSALGGTQGTGSGGSTAPNPTGLLVLTDTNRDGEVDDKDTAGLTDWAWKGSGAFFIANVDDDDKKGKVDSADTIVNGSSDEVDLARIIIRIPADVLAKTSSVSVSVSTGAAQTHLFEKTASGWTLVKDALTQTGAQIELGIEALRFADADWDGFATIKVDVLDAAKGSLASQQVKLHVAPWIMLPNSAKTELLYISSTTSRLRPDLNKVFQAVGVPEAVASNPGRQDIWFQDTMEIGYTQLPGKPPMHVVMKAQRPNASDDLAITLLARNFGFISIGSPRQPGNEEDHWMDWTGNLEVSHPVPGYPLGRIYYGKSDRTTFHPTIVKFLEAQQVQKPFALYTNWLFIQHVDEIVSFLPDKDGKAKMIIVSPAAANTVMGSGYDADNQKIQKYIDEDIALFKTELGLSDEDIIPIPTFFEGSGTDFAPTFANPVNSVYANGTFMMGKTGTPAQIKADIEKRLSAIGVQAAWVDDGEYHPGGGNVHCGTNTKKTPLCASFATCLP